MCCGKGSPVVILDTFTIDENRDDLILLSVSNVSATRRSQATVSKKYYYYGGNYKFVLAFPEDVDFLTSLTINNLQIMQEV